MSRPQLRSKVLLIGDSCTDEYRYGSVTRINPEAPIPILDLISHEIKEGMAKNVYHNLVAMGCKVDIITEFVQSKIRYVDIKSKQPMLRVDTPIKKKRFDIDLLPDTSQYECIIISDYDKKYLTYDDICSIIELSKCPVYIDTKKPDISKFKGATLKLNQYEWESKWSYHDDCVVTHGGDKVTYKDKTYNPPKVDVHDVCGAGDTFLAAFAISDNIDFAMKAAAITVQHLGVYAPTLSEINND